MSAAYCIISTQMHIVHIKQEYDTLNEALKDKNGVAVLGFFYQVSSNFSDDG